MRRNRLLVTALAGSIIALIAVLLVFQGGFGDGKGDAGDISSPGRESGAGDSSDRREHLPSKRRAAGRDPNKNARPLGELLDSLTGELKSLEAERISLLTEGRRGPSTVYLLAVPPPSNEEIQRVRSLISTLQKDCHEKDKEKLDARVKELLDEYDALGQKGKKVVVIQVKDQGNDGLTGFVLSATDFDEMKRQFDAGEPMSSGELSGYSPLDGLALRRFSAMMTNE